MSQNRPAYKTAISLVSVALLVLTYFVALIFGSVWLSLLIVQQIGINPLSDIGILILSIGSGIYMLFELALLNKNRPAPILVITMAVVLSPFIVYAGIGLLGREYNRIKETTFDTLPRLFIQTLVR